MKRLTFSIAAFSFILLFSGCGQSGPLYIPGNPSQMAVPPAQQDTASEEEREEEDDGDASESD